MVPDFSYLVSGTDLRGVALPGYGKQVNLTQHEAASAAFAFGTMLMERTGLEHPRVCVGHDPRLSAGALEAGALHGLSMAGCTPIALGLCTTPAMFLSTLMGPTADGAIMLTASHLPPERNGLKFFTREGGLNADEIRALAQAMRPLDAAPAPSDVLRIDFLPLYARTLTAFIAQERAQPLSGLRIALDAGNGSGGFFADVLADLGADVIPCNLAPDGLFPNHPPNPEDAGAMAFLSSVVRAQGADLGVMFDADCDRAALVDAQGGAINRDQLIALVAAYLLPAHPGATIVTDSVTSLGLSAFIASLGGQHLRFRRGYKYVIDEAKRQNEMGVHCPLAIETSGHCAFADHYFLDDGAHLVAWLLRHIAHDRAQGLDWTQRTAALRLPLEDIELRLPLLGPDFAQDGASILHALKQAAAAAGIPLAQDGGEGARLLAAPDGFLMARVSIHDPVLPINIQSTRAGDAQAMASFLHDFLAPYGDLIDRAPLRAIK